MSQNINEPAAQHDAFPRDAGAVFAGWTGWWDLGRCDEPMALVERTSLWQEQKSHLTLLRLSVAVI